MDKPILSLRQATPADLRFVRSSWFSSYRKGGCAPEVGFDLYEAGMGRVLDRLLFVPALVAFMPEVPDEVIAWAVHDGPVLHYVYVKHAFRRLGIGLEVCRAVRPLQHTHETRKGRHLAARLGTRYNPYLLMQGPGQ